MGAFGEHWELKGGHTMSHRFFASFIVALSRMESAMMKRVVLTLLWIVTATVICSAQTIFYYPHIVNGVLGGVILKTTIFITNPAATGTGLASGSITFMKDDPVLSGPGTPFNLTFTDETGQPAGSGNTIPFQIAGGQTRKFTSSGAGTYAGGLAIVSSNAPISGTAIFSEFDSAGRLIGEAGVPSGSAVSNQAVFVDTQGGYNVGVAYANPGTAGANVTLRLLNSSGVAVMSTVQTLGAGNHAAAFVSQLFPGAPELVGTMQITSQTPLSSIALRFDPTLSVFTTLPPVTLASLVLAVFRDPASAFATSDVRDVQDQIVRFDTVANSLIWAADGRSFPGYPVDGNFLRSDRSFQVRFGTKDGERRAYFTETATATMCDVEVIGGRLVISPTDVPVPGS